ncbi:polyadenylate-binding protein, partial [Strigomonas culicis]
MEGATDKKDAAPPQQNKPMQIASIYVGDLDPSINEPEMVELFKPFGTILNARVCRDIITQRSLGYGYVNYDNAADAEKAIEALNFTRVGDKCIRLMWQQRDPALRYSGNGNIFVKNLKQDVDSKGLHDIFKKFGSILSCKIMEDEQGASRGYGFVHFKEENAATTAIEKMNNSTDFSNEEKRALYVANFIRRNARLAALVANFTNVYIKQVIPTVDKKLVEKFFSKFGGITSAATGKDKSGRVFAFCNFQKHDDAVKAIEAMHEHHIDGITAPGEKLYVQRAQPRSERLIALRQKYMQCQSLGNNLYVRNFDPEFTDENLNELFKEYGTIKSCRVMTDANGNSRGFGFVSFADADQANEALREMNGRMLNGKPLIVNIAQRRDQRYTMLRMQFQQRLQMMMRQLHQQMPYVAGGTPQ